MSTPSSSQSGDAAQLPIPRSNVVHFRRRWARLGLTPCDARIEGPFLGSDATSLRCGDIAGHEGAHFFHVEWGGTATMRWVDTMPSRCDHTYDPTYDGHWCAICNPALGGDQGSA